MHVLQIVNKQQQTAINTKMPLNFHACKCLSSALSFNAKSNANMLLIRHVRRPAESSNESNWVGSRSISHALLPFPCYVWNYAYHCYSACHFYCAFNSVHKYLLYRYIYIVFVVEQKFIQLVHLMHTTKDTIENGSVKCKNNK